MISLTLKITFVDCSSTTEWSPLPWMRHLLTLSTTEWFPYLECDICWLFIYNWVISLTLNVTSLILNVTFVDCSSTTMLVSLNDLVLSLLRVPTDLLILSGVPISRSTRWRSNFFDFTTKKKCIHRRWMPSLQAKARANQNPYIEEEQTTQWPKEKVQKDKQRSTKHTYKTEDRVTRTH